MSSLLDEIENSKRQALESLGEADSAAELENWRLRFLSRGGELSALLKRVGAAAEQDKPTLGKAANEAKDSLWSAFGDKQGRLDPGRRGEPAADAAPELAAALEPTGGSTDGLPPLHAWFLGPKAEHADLWQELLSYTFQDYAHWRRNYFPGDPVTISRVRRREPETSSWTDGLTTHLDRALNDLKAHFPFYSPRYIAHMLSEQTLPSVLGYFAGMLYNPNNVTDEAAPVTVDLELQVGKMVAEMLGYDPRKTWAHLCSGGTVANLEALWVARTAQFTPFVVRDYARNRGYVRFSVRTPNGDEADVKELDDRQLISLRPNESIFMLRKLARYLVDELGQMPERALDDINHFRRSSEYNVAHRGFHSVARKLGKDGLAPLVFVSAAAHYSVKKAANVLGYGEEAVRRVPVTRRFRLDVGELEEMLLGIHDEREYVAAVVGIVGTTEEGAVDPVHELKWLRDRLSCERNRAFWLHVDAAWGGYISSLFRGHPLPKKHSELRGDLDEKCRDYADAIGATERFYIRVAPGMLPKPNQTESYRAVEVGWSDPEVYKAFLAIRSADSTTVDPHKLGYVPYPSGVVAFRNGLVTELVTQQAQYISDASEGVKEIDKPTQIEAVGSYILEGSKPGAAAASCWLAHKAIPLTAAGHGQIMKATLLSAKKLVRYLQSHRYLFGTIENELFEGRYCADPFTFEPLYEPDTNVVCFVAAPMRWAGRELHPVDMGLEWRNKLNKKVYERLSLPRPKPGETRKMPYGQEFFVSRTTFEREQYAADSIAEVLEKLGVESAEYEQHGLFVLRSTVMNPLYAEAEREGKQYLYDFLKHLHKVARSSMTEVMTEIRNTMPAG